MATALYRRYRPESFAEVIGQDHVTTPLRRALRAGRVGHAYLFSGPRGCGKTTSARILARCLNCAEGPTDTPCGTCDSCRDLARGGAGSLDVVEIDAASHGGVDDARELRERASFAPVRDRFKVFIIDEAHMVTSAGFNALLKLVEEPPEHVKFVFATTEPDKVIGTIRSRTHHYPFRLIPPQVLGPYLEEVCAAEQVGVGDGVMPLVVRAGGGSARDSMSVLDQLMAGAGDDGLDVATAIALLGFTDTALLDAAITAVAERDAAALYGAVEHVLATGHEPRRFVEDLLERMRDLIVLAAVPDRGADLLPQVPADELERMRGQAVLFAPADLSQCGDLVHETLATMSGATSPRLHLELLAARLVLRNERAALAAGDAGAPAEERRGGGPAERGGAPAAQPRSAGPTGPGGQPGVGAAQGAPSGASGAREEARRIAQEKAEAARQSRGGRGATPAAGAAPEGSTYAPAGGPDAVRSAPAPAAEPLPSQQSAAPGSAPTQQQPAPEQDRSGGPQPWGDVAAAPAPQGRGPQGSESQAQAPQGPPRQGSAPEEPTQQGPGPQEPAQQGPGSQEPPVQPSAAQAGPAAAGGLDPDQVRAHWSAILDELQQIRRPSWALISQNAHVNGAHGSTLVIGFRTDGLVNAFHRGTAAENLADAVRRIMHADVTVEAVVGDDPGPGSGGGPRGGGPGGGAGGGPAPGRGTAPGAGPGPFGESRAQPGPGDASREQTGQAAPARWGDAVSAMSPQGGATAPQGQAGPAPHEQQAPASPEQRAPAPEEQAGPSAGQRASERAMQAAARAAQSGRDAPPTDRVEDFAPEPEDPYPPDPEDDYRPRDRGPQTSGDAPAPPDAVPGPHHGAPAREADAAPAAPRGGDAPVPDPSPTGAEAPAAAPSGEIPVVEDAGRDSLGPGDMRTYGQNALRRAIAEGRVVHSRPAQNPAGPAGGSTGGAPQSVAPSDVPSGQGDPSGDGGRPALRAVPSPTADSAPSAPSAGPAPAGDAASTGSASARAAASWGTAAAIPGATAAPSTTAGSAPSASAPPAPAPSSAAPRSGAALVREAAQASRIAGQRGAVRQASASGAPVAEADPTGGATRDDEDAVVATRNGREVVEKLLGGKVLEIIDENGPR